MKTTKNIVSTNHSRKLTGAQEVAVSVKICKITLSCQEFFNKEKTRQNTLTHP